MSLSSISPGGNPPKDIHVVIEIPADSPPVKYEIDHESHAIFLDRILGTAMFYPLNYGFIPNTLSEDGDPADVLVMTPYPIQTGAVVRARPVGVLLMEDENGNDEKIIAVPNEKITPAYSHIQDIDDVDALLKGRIKHFFEHYKDLEVGKWVKIKDWAPKEVAFKLIEESIKRAKS